MSGAGAARRGAIRAAMILHELTASLGGRMQLIADRFAVDDDGRAVDLATGARVTLVTGACGGISDQRRWIARCDALRGLHHRVLAPLVDFGTIGESSRFEAWGCGGPWTGSPEMLGAQHDVAAAVLRGAGLTIGPGDAARIGRDGAVAWLPGADTGYPLGADYPDAESLPLRQRGLAHIDRRAVGALAEMLGSTPEPRPHVAALWGSPGAGRSTAALELARIARLNGLSPIAASLIQTRYADLIHGRSLFIIDDHARAAGWPALLHAVLRTALPHALLLVGEREVRGVDGVPLDLVAAETLVAAVRPRIADDGQAAWALRAAERAQGSPGRFAAILRPESAGRRERRRHLRAAEQPASYGAEPAIVAVPPTDVAPPKRDHAWPAPGELAALRRRMTSAAEQLSRGRHAPAIRQLRHAIGGFARRDAWTEAADGGLILASALLRRGRVREAQVALEETRQYAGRAGRDALLLDLAALSGDAWIDLARLDDAESVVGSAIASARAVRDVSRTRALSLVLARGLAWRGRWADAASVLGGPATDAPIGLRVRHAALASRIAVGQRDPVRAMALTTEIMEAARALGSEALTAAAVCAAAFVHLSVGDFEAVQRHAVAAIAAARAGHDPLRAVRARLLLAEAERRRGRPARALALLRRMGLLAAALPPVLRVRWEMIGALARGGDPRAVVTKHVASSGLDALALFADFRSAGQADAVEDSIAEELVSVLRVCQTAEDESAVLKTVCARVRKQTHAAAVAFVATRGGRTHMVEGDGGRLDPEIAERALSIGAAIAPHLHGDRIEAAAPVQYGGRLIGALCARWVLGCTHDLSRAPLVLTLAAAAAAPLLSAAIVRREQAPTLAVGAIGGVTEAARELRGAVERAAPAPFPVLITGESGSGKELVARAVHRAGARRDRPFCTLNCAALPDDLVEAELFGHTRGAFTGAVADRPGVFEEAHGGTLLLDEVGELSPRAQAKVLRVIQEGELRRVGENLCRRIDVRLIAATNRELSQEVAAGRFRLDLLYRLDVLRITVPPLRERREDIIVLAEQIWRECTARLGSRATLGAATIGALARYDWPGNVRELQNVLAAVAVRCPRRGVVPPEALPPQCGGHVNLATSRLEDARRQFEARFVRAALARSGGQRRRAAEELGVTRQGLTKLMTRLGIGPEAEQPASDDPPPTTHDHL
ncbi:MAG: sigma 54-interacting transcriptional regulator [Acidobacteria bacterium]|nr:sigma 54-interacting transcriptional regulator [Acidobacteriota bacterium]